MRTKVVAGLAITFVGCAKPPAVAPPPPLATPKAPAPSAVSAEPARGAAPREPSWVSFAPPPSRALAFSADRRFAVLSHGGQAWLWDVSKALPRVALGAAGAAAFSASGRYLALSDYRQIRVIERATNREVGKALSTKDRLVALLEGPLRVVTESGGKLRVSELTSGNNLGERACGEVVAVSATGRLALVQSPSEHAKVVALPECRAIARWQPSGDATVYEVTHAAFSRDDRHAFASVGTRDVNGRGMTSQLLHWNGSEKFESLATFEATPSEALDFEELISSNDGNTVTLANVEHFVPRSCVNCTYADKDSIGYTKDYESFLVVDVKSRAVSSEWSLEGEGPMAFFSRRPDESRMMKWLPWPGFAAPLRSLRRVVSSFPVSGNDRASLVVGETAFALTRGHDGFIVDIATGELTRVAGIQKAEFAADGTSLLVQQISSGVELRRMGVADAPVLSRVADGTMRYGEVHLTEDPLRFVVARWRQSAVVAGPDLPERPLAIPPDCLIVDAALTHCVAANGDVHKVGTPQPVLRLGKLLGQSWNAQRALGMVLNAKKELLLVDLASSSVRRLDVDTAEKPACAATQPKDLACQVALGNYYELRVPDDFLSPMGDRWIAHRRLSSFVGSTALGKAERELGPISQFRWSKDGAFLDVFSGDTWRRIDLVRGTESQPGKLKRWLSTPLVEVAGKLSLLMSDDRFVALPTLPAQDADKVRGALRQGEFLLLEEGADLVLFRTESGTRLRLAFPDLGNPAWLANDGLPFDADEALLDRLSFVSRAEPGAAPIASGRELSARCLDHELLRKFVAGESLRCRPN